MTNTPKFYPWVIGTIADPNAPTVFYSAGTGGPMVALRYAELEFMMVDCRDDSPT